MYHIVLFDLDGTLTDSGQGILHSVSYALQKLGITYSDPSELRRFIGPPLYESFASFYNLNSDETQLAVSLFREYFKEKGMFENQLYPDIVSLLEELKVAGIRLVIATSKPEKFAKQIVEYFGIEHYFEVIAGASLDNSRTSKEDVISYAITQLNPHSSSIIMIGDRKHDIQGAHANYLPAIGILYGYGTREELEEAGADFIIDSVSNLKDFLLKK